ncbi:MAG: ABC transporter permease [Bdellovibrionia bacterium]
MLSFFRIAWRNATLNWRHSLMAIISVAAGFVSLSIFQNYMLDVKHMYVKTYEQRFMYGQLIVEKKGAQQNRGIDSPAPELNELDVREQAWIANYLSSHPSEVQKSVRFLKVFGMIGNGSANTIFSGYGYDIQNGAELRKPNWEWNTLAGKPLQLSPQPNGIVLGVSLASILGCEPEQKSHYLNGQGGYEAIERPFKCRQTGDFQLNVATESGQANALTGSLVGIIDAAYKDLDTKFVAMPLEMAQTLMATQKLSYISVQLSDSTDALSFANKMRADASGAGIQLDVTRWQDHPDGDLYVRTMSLLTIFRNFVVAVILVIAGLSVLSTMIKIVTERTREIGTLRSMGYSRHQVLALFALEVFLLSVIGIATGLLTALASSWAINLIGLTYKAGMLTEPVPFRVAFSAPIYISSAVFLVVIATLAAVVPAYQATGRRVSELLTHV